MTLDLKRMELTLSGLSWKSGFSRYRLLSTAATQTQEPFSPRTRRVMGSPGMLSLADRETDTCNPYVGLKAEIFMRQHASTTAKGDELGYLLTV